MSERRRMAVVDWVTATFNVAIGLFLGLALNGLLELVIDGAWAVALIIAILSVGLAMLLIYFDGLIANLFDRIFPSGVRSARAPDANDRRPIGRLLSLPVGLVLGMILARLGWSSAILGLF